VTSNACVVDEFASEGPTAVVTTAAAPKACSAMFLQLRNSDLDRAFAENLMTFRASNPLSLRVSLMCESVVVSLTHLRRRLLVACNRMTLAATRAADFLARLHLFGSLVANVALSMTGKSCSRAGDCVAARAIGSLLACLIRRMGLVRKLDAERLALGKVNHRRLHGRYSLVTI